MKSEKISADAVRFIIGGIVNTTFTYLVFLLALQVSNYTVAYFISWIVGIIFVITVYPSAVFVGSEVSTRKRIITGLQYIIVFFLGLTFLKVLVAHFGISEYTSMGLTIVFTTLVNFTLMRLIFRKKIQL